MVDSRHPSRQLHFTTARHPSHSGDSQSDREARECAQKCGLAHLDHGGWRRQRLRVESDDEDSLDGTPPVARR